MMKLKIGAGIRAAGESTLMVAWIVDHILASASGQDDIIHLYDLETENNYILRTGMYGLIDYLAFCLREIGLVDHPQRDSALGIIIVQQYGTLNYSITSSHAKCQCTKVIMERMSNSTCCDICQSAQRTCSDHNECLKVPF